MLRFFATFKAWMAAILAMSILSACVQPVAKIVAPTVAEATMSVPFKAEMLPIFSSVDVKTLKFTWDFGDGSTGAGAEVSHVFQQAGEFHVNLNVVDADGVMYPSEEVIIQVQPFTGTWVPVSVRVYDASPSNGQQAAGQMALQNASVTVAGQSQQTDEAGGVLFNFTQPAQAPVAIISKPGYVTQAVTVPNGNAQERGVVVQLKRQALAVQIADVAQAQTVNAEDTLVDTQSAKVVLPPQAFVNAAGEPVTGAATARVTPWNITDPADMSAFPGERRADGGTAGIVKLISFGMLTIEFEQNGQKLQLAPGKTADISMNLPVNTDIDGNTIQVGDTIPLWHFNETRGLWEREGTGVVIAADTSPTGMAVKATVSHFSSWNWDKIQDPTASPVSRQVRCVIPDDVGNNKPLAANDICVVQVSQTLPNGTVLTDSLAVPTGGSVFANFVSTANVAFSAEALLAGRRGIATWQVNAAEAGAVLDIVLTQELVITVVPGDVPVVVEQPAQLDFHIDLSQFSNYALRPKDMKWWIKATDGTLSELPFQPYLREAAGADDGVSTTMDYTYHVFGGGSAAGATMLGTLSGSLVAQLPVDKYGNTANGQWGILDTIYQSVELLPIAPKTYGGPTLIQAPAESDANSAYGLTFALWDEVGVSTPVNADSKIELSFMTVDGGWTSAYTPWLETTNPWWINSAPNGAQNGTLTNAFKPYFTLNWDSCSPVGMTMFGTHKVVMRVRVTNSITSEQQVYNSKPIVIDFGGNGRPCT